MKQFPHSLPPLAGVALGLAVGLAVGFGIGRLGKGTAADGAAVSEAREGENAAVLEPAVVTGQSAKEKAARAEVRPFQPGRPFPRGGAEAWLMGLRKEGFDDSDIAGMAGIFRKLGTLDGASAREVVEAVIAIVERTNADDEGDETWSLWEDHEDMLEAALASALGIVTKEYPEGALALLEALDELDESEELISMVWTEIARNASGRLESLLAGLDDEDEDVFPYALRGAVLGLAGSDPEAAMALLAKYPGEDFGDVREELIERMMATDPCRGVEMAAAFARDGEAGELRSAFGEWLDTDEDSARTWLEHYDGPGRDAARGRLLFVDAFDDPRAAMVEYAAMRARGATDEDLDGLAGMVVGRMVAVDPGAATAARTWVEALPGGGNRDEAVVSLARAWAERDAPAASEWIATLPEGGVRDNAVVALSESIHGSDPAAALQWARSIDSESIRIVSTRSILALWFTRDPVAAGEAAAALPEAERGGHTGGGAIESDAIDALLNELGPFPNDGHNGNYRFVPPGGIPLGSGDADLFPGE